MRNYQEGANPFAFKVGDKQMMKQHAPQYYPPHKRKEMKEHLTRSSIKFSQQPMSHEINDKNLKITEDKYISKKHQYIFFNEIYVDL